MPILILLKSPRMNLIAQGEIKDGDENKWDEIFHNQVLMVKNQSGRNTLIPLLQDCNIAFMQEVTEEEIEEQEKMAEKRRKEKEAQGGGSGVITKPDMLFPSGKRGRS